MIEAVKELQRALASKKTELKRLLSEGKMTELHMELNLIASFAGKRSSMEISINFPERYKMDEVIRGERNIIIVSHPLRKKFGVPVAEIIGKAASFFPGSQLKNFENGEGFHIIFSGGKISMFPGSVHLWCNVNKAEKFLVWAMDSVYK